MPFIWRIVHRAQNARGPGADRRGTTKALGGVEVCAASRAHFAPIDRIQTINAVVAESIAKQDAVGYFRANLEFHRTLYLRAQAPAMRKLYGGLNRTELPSGRRLIVAALRAGDELGLRLAVRADVSLGLRMLVG